MKIKSKTAFLLATICLSAGGSALAVKPLTPQCGGTAPITPANARMHFSHATPWTAESIIAGACPNPTSSASPRCQVTTKVVLEDNDGYAGLRLKNADTYTTTGCVGGDNVSIDGGDIILTFKLINVGAAQSATYGVPGPGPTGGDYVLYESEAQNVGERLIPDSNNSWRFEMTLQDDNFCGTYADYFSSILLKTASNDDVVGLNNDRTGGATVEFVDIELESARFEPIGGGPQTIPLGWNHRVRWVIIDDGTD